MHYGVMPPILFTSDHSLAQREIVALVVCSIRLNAMLDDFMSILFRPHSKIKCASSSIQPTLCLFLQRSERSELEGLTEKQWCLQCLPGTAFKPLPGQDERHRHHGNVEIENWAVSRGRGLQVISAAVSFGSKSHVETQERIAQLLNSP